VLDNNDMVYLSSFIAADMSLTTDKFAIIVEALTANI